MRDGSPQPAAKQPDDIEYSAQTACTPTIAHHLCTKGCQHYQSYLKTLQPEWDAYYSKAQHYPADKITQRA